MAETGGTFPIPDGQIKATDPHRESVVGYNFPYRGQEQHGVGVAAEPWIPQDGDAESWEGRTDYAPDETEITPVPVRIVNDSSGEIRQWRALQTDADGAPRLISGRNEAMARVQVANLSATATDVVYIGPDITVSRFSGYPVTPGVPVTINTTGAVYAITDGSITVTVAVLIEHSVRD